MKITTKGRYGIRAIVNLAAADQNNPVSISQIAAEENISPEFLEQIFFRLKKAGLIRSLRGPKGGFILNRKVSDISLRDVLVAVDESLYPAPCTDRRLDEPCPRVDVCSVHPVWDELSTLVNDYLEKVSIKDLLDKDRKSYYKELASGQSFSI